MAICVHCSAHTASLFVSYGPTNLLCTRCKACGQYADPYVEHEAVIVAIDLILVKPRAYRHILFNRPHLVLPKGSNLEASRQATETLGQGSSRKLERRASLSRAADTLKERTNAGVTFSSGREVWSAWWRLAKRFAAITLIDAYLRWFYLCASSMELGSTERSQASASNRIQNLSIEADALSSYLGVLRATLLQSIALHLCTLVLSILYHRALRLFQDRSATDLDLDRFRSHLIPSALLLSNVTPTLLLALLLLWQAPRPIASPDPASSATWMSRGTMQWDESSLDWAIRSLVGGLSAGVGLGVVLPRQRTKLGALATTVILFGAWFVQALVSEWVGLPLTSGSSILETDEGARAAALYCTRRA